MTPDHAQLRASGTLVEHRRGDTWNDGGSWNTWVYELGGRLWRVRQPSDYQPENVEIAEVFHRETVVVTYDTKEHR